MFRLARGRAVCSTYGGLPRAPGPYGLLRSATPLRRCASHAAIVRDNFRSTRHLRHQQRGDGGNVRTEQHAFFHPPQIPLRRHYSSGFHYAGQSGDSIFALGTSPVGKSGIAVIRISGDRAQNVARSPVSRVALMLTSLFTVSSVRQDRPYGR